MGFWFLVGIARVFLVSSFHVLVGCVLGFFFLFLGGLSCFVPFVSSFLSFWGHGWPPLRFGGSGVLSQGAGSLCVFLVCLDIPW